MRLSDFRVRVALRVAVLGLTMAGFVFMVSRPNMLFAAGLTFLIVVGELAELFHFVSVTNRKLTRFLESVKYQDFISGFTADNKLGESFRDLNLRFNEVLEAFRKARSEKEENWQYLTTIVQQVRTGILSYDQEGRVQLINQNAKRFLGVSVIKNIHELNASNSGLYQVLLHLETGKSALYKTDAFQLTIQSSELRMRSTDVKLVTLQNIQSELQQQELEAWQNLTRVLRHEIMNSITPISSLTSTLREILDHDLTDHQTHFELKTEGAEDLREGLNTIENRSKGLIKFIDAYREYTSLPQPKIKSVFLKSLLDKVAQLMKPEFRKTTFAFTVTCDSDYITLQIDEEMIEQVLINLLKNAIESLHGMPDGRVELAGRYTESGVVIEVADNGPGIIREALDRIFVPFFTTKKTGSGIGLSLSRQIMQMHNGTLTAESEPHVRTVFRLKF